MTDTLDHWPKHPDGRRMKIGEMSPEQERVFTDAARTHLNRVIEAERDNKILKAADAIKAHLANRG